VTVDCPLDCTYLIEARSREQPPEVDPRQFPNSDIRISEDFLRKNEPLLIVVAAALAKSAVETQGAIDNDVRETLDSLVRIYRATQSGLYFESQPANVLAARIQSDVQERIADLSRRATEAGASIRDADILGVLAFLQRLEIQHNNHRPKGRAFIHFLQQFFPQSEREGGLISTA
jgi:hypothetical protein